MDKFSQLHLGQTAKELEAAKKLYPLLNKAFKDASENELKGILGYTDEPLVSHDFNGNPLSSIIDSDLTMVMEDNMVKVFSWYDNEMGYATRCVDLAVYMANQGL